MHSKMLCVAIHSKWQENQTSWKLKGDRDFYGVTVISVNTAVSPAKDRSRFTKAGILKGRKPAYKKLM